MTNDDVVRVSVRRMDDDELVESVRELAGNFALVLKRVPLGESIPNSYWGDPEAGIRDGTIYFRPDTPVHSMLHEIGHVICGRVSSRPAVVRDAGGDDLEESAVCYLQILLADGISGVDRCSIIRDMDSWGYSFRLGSTQRWFEADAMDAREWLQARGLVTREGILLPRSSHRLSTCSKTKRPGPIF